MPMNETLHQLTAVKLVVVVRVMHLEEMELKLLLWHIGCVNRNIHVLLDVPKMIILGIEKEPNHT